MHVSKRGRRGLTTTVIRATVSVVAIVAGYFVLPVGDSLDGSFVLRSVLAAAAVFGVVVVTIVTVSRSSAPVLRAIEALSTAIAFVLVVGAAVNLSISKADPDAYSEPLDHVDALYFSLTTMTTVGFGDIGTVSSGARIALMFIMVGNVLVLGVSVRAVMRIASDRRDRLAADEAAAAAADAG